MALINGGGTPVCPPGFHYDKTFLQCLPGRACKLGSLEEMLGLCDPREEGVPAGSLIGWDAVFDRPSSVPISPIFIPIFTAAGFNVRQFIESADGKSIRVRLETNAKRSFGSILDSIAANWIKVLRLLGLGVGTIAGVSLAVDPQGTLNVGAGWLKKALIGAGQGVIGNGNGKDKPPTEDLKNLLYFGVGLGLILLIVKR